MTDRYFFKLQDEVTWEDVVSAAHESFIKTVNDRSDSPSLDQYAIGYPDTGTIYRGWSLYHTEGYNDYAFDELTEFLVSIQAGSSIGCCVERGQDGWRDVDYWPHMISYNSLNTPTNKQSKEVRQMAKAELYTVAAIWRPEYPAGTTIELVDIEHPQILLAPFNFLARSEQEALAKAAQIPEVVKYVNRLDGQIDWQIRKAF